MSGREGGYSGFPENYSLLCRPAQLRIVGGYLWVRVSGFLLAGGRRRVEGCSFAEKLCGYMLVCVCVVSTVRGKRSQIDSW